MQRTVFPVFDHFVVGVIYSSAMALGAVSATYFAG